LARLGAFALVRVAARRGRASDGRGRATLPSEDRGSEQPQRRLAETSATDSAVVEELILTALGRLVLRALGKRRLRKRALRRLARVVRSLLPTHRHDTGCAEEELERRVRLVFEVSRREKIANSENFFPTSSPSPRRPCARFILDVSTYAEFLMARQN